MHEIKRKLIVSVNFIAGARQAQEADEVSSMESGVKEDGDDAAQASY